MSSQERGCVVVGAGLAGAKLVETLREEGFAEPVTLLGEETERPYERPGLSKDYLQGRTSLSDLYVHPSDWYAEHQVETRFGEQVVFIDRERSQLRLRSGDTVAYGRLVLATGATPRLLSLTGIDLAGVHTLRRIEDRDALRAALGPGRRVVIIGGGWIGLEVAAAARLPGCEVTVLEAAEVPLERTLGKQLGRYFAGLHRRNGVDLRTGAAVSALLGTGGRVSGVQTDGEVLPADVVLVAVGVAPNSRLAADAGLAISNGVVVDEHLRSSDPGVLAVGDVANAYHPILGRRIRVEHWDNAIRHGTLAAATILGRADRYDWQPYFYTDQYDTGMEYVGSSEPDDEVVIRGDIDTGAFLAFWTRAGAVTAAMNVNVWDVNEQLRALIGRRIAGGRLRDTDIALPDLLKPKPHRRRHGGPF